MLKPKSYKEHLLKQLQNSEEAAAYLNEALQDGDPGIFLLALSDIDEAKAEVNWLVDESDTNR